MIIDINSKEILKKVKIPYIDLNKFKEGDYRNLQQSFDGKYLLFNTYKNGSYIIETENYSIMKLPEEYSFIKWRR